MKSIYFIFNMKSGKAAISSKLALVTDAFTKAGYEVTLHPTQSRGDASQAAVRACDKWYDLIVCSGGDGTLNEVIQGVMKAKNKLPIGYLPTGSTNDFARSAGIPTNIEKAVQNVLDGSPKYFDIGKLNDRSFTYIAAFGAFIEVTYETPQNMKNILGHAAYILNGILHVGKIRSHRIKVTTDTEVFEDDFIFGMVTNSSSVAGILSLDDFLCDDGLFEVTLIKKPSNPIALQKTIRGLLKLENDLDTKYIKSFRASKVTFESSDEINWTVDGEFGGALSCAEIVNFNRAVEIITGASSNERDNKTNDMTV